MKRPNILLNDKTVNSFGRIFGSFYLCSFTYKSRYRIIAKDNIGGAKKQALPITEEEEDTLWSKNVLGDDTREKLLYTLVYLMGLNFALRGGEEHRHLASKADVNRRHRIYLNLDTY
jgi:hypothetical protein